jgi:hypothetical protein
MRRVCGMLALACVLLGVGPAYAQETAAPFCWDFDRIGSDGAERLDGSSAADHLAAFGGDDHVHAYGGADCVSAGAGNDEIELGLGDDAGLGRGGHDLLDGGPGNDVLYGGLGADRLFGGDGDDLLADDAVDRARDVLDGGAGNDELRAGLGADVLLGGDGDDELHAANGAIDELDCGAGTDRAFADRGDVVTGCEEVVTGYRPAVRVKRAVRTFTLSWDSESPARVEPAGYPPVRAGCARGSWRIRTTMGRATLTWAGRRPPCPGRYLWRVVTTDAEVERVDCETAAGRLLSKGAPPERGCARRETIGEASYTVAGAKP